MIVLSKSCVIKTVRGCKPYQLPQGVVPAQKWRMCEMATTTKNQWSITKYEQDTYLLTWIEAFLIDRKAQGMAK